jgi:hypothetical protein
MNFFVGGQAVDSVELKCLVVSRGLKIDKEVYQKCGKDFRNMLICKEHIVLSYIRRSRTI